MKKQKLEVLEVKSEEGKAVKVYSLNSKELAERLHSAREKLREAGEWVGGRIPFGYRVHRGYVEIESYEARIVKRAYELKYVEKKRTIEVYNTLVKEGAKAIAKGKNLNEEVEYKNLSKASLYRFFEEDRMNLYLGLGYAPAIITEYHLGQGTTK